jgi:thiol-disulfide isomerase/thioredoxin
MRSFLAGLLLGISLSCFLIWRGYEKLTSPPSLALEDLTLVKPDGAPVKPEDYSGKKVLLNIWATWCKPCIAEMPLLDSLYISLPNPREYLFLVVSDEDSSTIARFAEDQIYTFSFTRSLTPFRQLGIRTFPSTYIFDEQGKLLWMKSGQLTGTTELRTVLISGSK